MWVLGGAVIVVVWWAVALALIDARSHRLPDTLTLPAALGCLLGALFHDPWILLGGIAWAGLYTLGRGIGGGDVKLALSLGTVAAAAAGAGGVILAVLVASAVTVTRGVEKRQTVAHGPSMLVGALAAVVVGVMGEVGVRS